MPKRNRSNKNEDPAAGPSEARPRETVGPAVQEFTPSGEPILKVPQVSFNSHAGTTACDLTLSRELWIETEMMSSGTWEAELM